MLPGSNIRTFYFRKEFFYVFPVEKMTEFGLKFSKVLMLSAQLLGRIPLGNMMVPENKIAAFNLSVILVLTFFYYYS